MVDICKHRVWHGHKCIDPQNTCSQGQAGSTRQRAWERSTHTHTGRNQWTLRPHIMRLIWKRPVPFSHSFVQDLLYVEQELFHSPVITVVRTYFSLAASPCYLAPTFQNLLLNWNFNLTSQTQVIKKGLLTQLCNCHAGTLCEPDSLCSSKGHFR